MTAHRHAISRGLVAAGTVGFALLWLGAGTAHAEDTPAAYIEVVEPSANVTLEYGQTWYFVALGRNTFPIVPTTVTASLDGAPSDYAINTVWQQHNSAYDTYISIYPNYDQAPLKPGTYALHISEQSGQNADNSAHPASLKVLPAPLGTELRVLADAANGDAAIVTTRFTGRFVDEYYSSSIPGAPISPAGVWHIAISDAADEVVLERNIERAAGDDVLSTSFYWQDAKPGETYTASAEFTPNGASASNFTIAPTVDFTYTAPEAQRPVPTSTATANPAVTLPEASGFGLPLWMLIVTGVLGLGLAVLVTILGLRLRRPLGVAMDGVAQ